MRILLIVAVATYILSSCGSNPNEAEIVKVDSLLVQLRSAKMELDSINPESLETIKDSIIFDIKFVETEYMDTMPLDRAIEVDVYHRVLKSAIKFERTYNDQQGDLRYSLEQLTDMKKDLESGILVKESFEEFYPAEEEAAARLLESNDNIKIWYESIEKDYLKRREPVRTMMRQIKEKKGY